MARIPKVILAIETSAAYGRGLLLGIAKYSRILGTWAFYSEPGGEQTSLPRLDSWGASGIIARVADEKDAKRFIDTGLPTIFVPLKQTVPGFPNIIDDCATEGKMAAQHLLDRGFRNFTFCGFTGMYWSQERRNSFCKTIAQAGFQTRCYDRKRVKVHPHYESEQRLLADWLKCLPKPVGLMACDDEHGRHVIEACKLAALHVPEQIAVIGVDNDRVVCALSDPPLSSIAVNTERAGYEAAQLLDELMARKKKTRRKNIIVKPLHIVTRQSTDILAIEDRLVAQAVRFIREHAKDAITVDDVVDAATISRRPLEKRFRRVLNRSLLQEIRRVRAKHVAHMLAGTNLSISHIAAALGYPNVKHIARSFRHEKGMTPLAYRQKYGQK